MRQRSLHRPAGRAERLGVRSRSAEETAAECTSIRDRYTAAPPDARSSSARVGARRSGHDVSSHSWPHNTVPRRLLRNLVQALRERGAAGEVKPAGKQARRGGVDVRIHEGRSDQRATQLQHLVGVAATRPVLSSPAQSTVPSTTASAVAPATDGMCPPTSNVVLMGSSIAVDRDHLVDRPPPPELQIHRRIHPGLVVAERSLALSQARRLKSGARRLVYDLALTTAPGAKRTGVRPDAERSIRRRTNARVGGRRSSRPNTSDTKPGRTISTPAAAINIPSSSSWCGGLRVRSASTNAARARAPSRRSNAAPTSDARISNPMVARTPIACPTATSTVNSTRRRQEGCQQDRHGAVLPGDRW